MGRPPKMHIQKIKIMLCAVILTVTYSSKCSVFEEYHSACSQ